MASHIGIWIDRKQAVMVILNEQGEQIRRLVSGVSKRVAVRGKTRSKNPNGTQPLPAEDRKDRQFIERLNQYYETVSASLRDAASVFIFGPGEAKVELERKLAREKASPPIAAVEAADKMTDRQIAAKVRKFFNP
ncbi:MAG: hypothetical protein HY869_18330 [Chloroflexi bacterium]|nr:hypothetical protein [Chloroflexota bacterium]